MSKASDIIDNVISTIQGITAGATYTNTVSNATFNGINQVEQGARHYSKIPPDQFPHFNVLFGQEVRTPEPSFLKSVFRIHVEVTFNGNTEAQIASWLKDIEVALAQDIRRGNTTFVHDSFVSEINWDRGEVDPIRIIRMEIYCRYSFRFGQP